MKKILVLGAGRSATTLLHFLNKHAPLEQWHVTVADADQQTLIAKLKYYENIIGKALDVQNVSARADLVKSHDFVISLLPWTLHILVAKDCLDLNKHLITASYVTPEIHEIAAAAKKKGLFFMGELGLDPGIDHMSALQLLNKIQKSGGQINSFHSYAGGLIAAESDTNPWHYKITWNPRNVVLAGQGTAQYLEKGHPVFQPYNQLFANARPIDIGGKDHYEVYANRDSLKYRDLYGLHDIPSIMRGTVRYRGFSKAWDALIRLGLTDSTSPLHVSDGFTWAELIRAILPGANDLGLKDRCLQFLDLAKSDPISHQLDWLGIFSDEPIGRSGQTPADYLLALIERKWKLIPGDKDLVVMEHRIQYTIAGKELECRSSLEHTGQDDNYTAMADLVGLPLGMCARLFLRGQLPLPKEPLPFEEDIYSPIMRDLGIEGVHFNESVYTRNDKEDWELITDSKG